MRYFVEKVTKKCWNLSCSFSFPICRSYNPYFSEIKFQFFFAMTLWWIPRFSNQSTKAPPALPTGKTKIPSYIRHLDDRTLTVALPTTLGAIAPIWPGTPHTVLAIGKSCWILGKWWLTWCKKIEKGHALQLTSSCELGKKKRASYRPTSSSSLNSCLLQSLFLHDDPQ